MISAKDIFFLEREHLNELYQLWRKSDLPESILDFPADIKENDFNELKRTMIDHELKPLEAAKRGCTLSAYQINKAVKQAAKDE